MFSITPLSWKANMNKKVKKFVFTNASVEEKYRTCQKHIKYMTTHVEG